MWSRTIQHGTGDCPHNNSIFSKMSTKNSSCLFVRTDKLHVYVSDLCADGTFAVIFERCLCCLSLVVKVSCSVYADASSAIWLTLIFYQSRVPTSSLSSRERRDSKEWNWLVIDRLTSTCEAVCVYSHPSGNWKPKCCSSQRTWELDCASSACVRLYPQK